MIPLTLVDDAYTSVKLSNSARGWVLAELIRYHGTSELVTRDHLLASIWSSYCLQSSNSNLNQYVSLILKD